MNYQLPPPAMSKQINAFTEQIMDVAWFSAEQMQEAYQAGIDSAKCEVQLSETEVIDIAIRWSNSTFVSNAERFIIDYAREILTAANKKAGAL